MNDFDEFYQELVVLLPKSNADRRKVWARKIIEEDIELKGLSDLLFCEEVVASRFLWMMSEIGEIDPPTLLKLLPHLHFVKDKINLISTEASFANFWLIAGVPIENEGQVIDLLFEWVLSPTMSVTTKSRALFVLLNLTQKYPELKNELKLCIEDQMDKYSADFSKRAKKIVLRLNN